MVQTEYDLHQGQTHSWKAECDSRSAFLDWPSASHRLDAGSQPCERDLPATWGFPNMDLFATCHKKQGPVLVSPAPNPWAREVDALSISWEGLEAYAFPPRQILGHVLKF